MLEVHMDAAMPCKIKDKKPDQPTGNWRRLEIFGCTCDLDQTARVQTKLSLDLKFNRWDTAITFRSERRSMSKTVFAQYDPFETWYTCQSDVWLDDVKTFYPRPMRCVSVVHPYPLAQEDTTLLTDSAYLSCANIFIDDSRFSPDLHKDKRVTLNKRQKNEISNRAALIKESNQVMWILLTNTIPHGRKIMYMVALATSKYDGSWTFLQDIDLRKIGQQLSRSLIHSITGNALVTKRERERQSDHHC